MQTPQRGLFVMVPLLAVAGVIVAVGLPLFVGADRSRPTLGFNAGLFDQDKHNVANPSAVAGGAVQMRSLADLVIKSTQSQSGSATALRIEVANLGSAASQSTTLAVFYQRGGVVVKKSFNVPAIGPNQARWVETDLESSLAHADRLTARVNDSGGAKESDLSNNTKTIK